MATLTDPNEYLPTDTAERYERTAYAPLAVVYYLANGERSDEEVYCPVRSSREQERECAMREAINSTCAVPFECDYAVVYATNPIDDAHRPLFDLPIYQTLPVARAEAR